MYAVIKTGGKQYRVQAGDLIVVDKLAGEPGARVAFDQVLMIGDGEAVVVGAPLISGASVSATLIETRKGDKIKVFKKIRRQGYRRTRGHRQHESVLRVIGIDGDGKSAAWTGAVDLTPRAELRARARGLARGMAKTSAEADARAAFADEPAPRPAAKKPAAKKPAVKAEPKAKAKAKPAAKPAKKAAAKPAPAKTAPKKPAAKKAKPADKA
ncbi:MAG TPA: 50S ribosomal protein L21 [Caulobacteraceae bacterium]|jgi:large subunit ribosomal protein L21|nr:50S ribosomal protein L21 [Caulobacteraceae bacterium]